MLKIKAKTSTFLLRDVGVLIEESPGSVFEDQKLILELSRSPLLRVLVESGDAIIIDDSVDLPPAAGLQYLSTLWSQSGSEVPARPPAALSTGLVSGGLLSVNGSDSTKFDLSAGFGFIVDNYSDPSKPSIKFVEWPDMVGVEDPLLASGTDTYILMDGDGNLVFQGDPPTCIQRRTYINIGWTSHPDGMDLYDAVTEPTLAIDSINQMADFAAAFGAMNVRGNIYGPKSGLKIERSAGIVFDEGSNYRNNPKQPHVLHCTAESPVAEIWYFYRDPADPTGWKNDLPSVEEIDPDHYDDGTGTLASVPSGKWTVQPVTYYGIWNATDIQYGQAYYDTMEDAIQHGIYSDPPVMNPWNADWDVLRGWIVVQQGATDLTDPGKARFIEAGKFGSVMGIGGGGSGGGEANTASNQGLTGVGPFLTKVGVDLQFKNIRAASTKITVADNGTQKTVDIDLGPHKSTHENGGSDQISVAGLTGLLSTPQTPASHASSHGAAGSDQLPHQSLFGAGTNTHSQIDSHIGSTSNPHSTTASQVGAPPTSRQIATSNGLQGGGDLSADRTLSPVYGSSANTVCQGDDARLSDTRLPRDYQMVAEDARTTTTSATYQNKLTMTIPDGLMGTYRVSAFAVLDQGGASQIGWCRLYNETDAVVLYECNHRPSSTAVQTSMVLRCPDCVLTGSQKTIRLQFRSDVAGNTTGIRWARIELWRVL